MILILNDVSGSEILLILAFVLIFFGSKSIPGLARTLGRTMRQIKDASAEIQNEIKKSGADMKKDLNLTGILEDTANDIKRPLDQHVADIENAVKFEPPKTQSHIQTNQEKKVEEAVVKPSESNSQQFEKEEKKPEDLNEK